MIDNALNVQQRLMRHTEYDEESGEWFGFCEYHYGDYFCSYGKRKDGDE